MKENKKVAENLLNIKSIKAITAIHEAGHAIVYHIYGYHTTSISIDNDGSGFVS